MNFARFPIHVLGGAIGCTLVACAADVGDASTSTNALGSCPGEERSGFDCTTPGQLCKAQCFATDSNAGAFASFDVDGRALDSRAVPYRPWLSLTNVLIYGCNLWSYGDHQALSVQYVKLFHSDGLAGTRSDFVDRVLVYAPNFTGPGTYRADVSYLASDEAMVAGDRHAATGACTMTVASGEHGGVKGTIACDPIPSSSSGTTDTTVAVKGEFACGGSALMPIFSKLRTP